MVRAPKSFKMSVGAIQWPQQGHGIRAHNFLISKGVALHVCDGAEVVIEAWEEQVRKYTRTLTVKQFIVIAFKLDYHAIDRVEPKTGGAHIVINPIAVSFA